MNLLRDATCSCVRHFKRGRDVEIKKMNNNTDLYEKYGEYNIWFNQLNLPSFSVEYAWRKTKVIIQNLAQKYIESKKNNKTLQVVDVGCGNGALLIRIAENNSKLGKQIQFRGFDLSESFVEYSNKAVKYKGLANVSFSQIDLEKDKIPGGYDLVIMSEVLEHLNNPKQVLKKIYDSLNPGGVLLISTPNSKNLIKYPFIFLKSLIGRKDSLEMSKHLTQEEQRHKLAEQEQHLYVFSQPELIKLLKNVGFIKNHAFRSTTLFGGPFLDNHPLLFGLIIFLDKIFDILSFTQVGWDNIISSEKP